MHAGESPESSSGVETKGLVFNVTKEKCVSQRASYSGACFILFPVHGRCYILYLHAPSTGILVGDGVSSIK